MFGRHLIFNVYQAHALHHDAAQWRAHVKENQVEEPSLEEREQSLPLIVREMLRKRRNIAARTQPPKPEPEPPKPAPLPPEETGRAVGDFKLRPARIQQMVEELRRSASHG